MTEGERETGAEGEIGSPDAGKLSMTADKKREGGRRASFRISEGEGNSRNQSGSYVRERGGGRFGLVRWRLKEPSGFLDGNVFGRSEGEQAFMIKERELDSLSRLVGGHHCNSSIWGGGL